MVERQPTTIKQTKKEASPGKGENMISKVNILLDSNVQFSTATTNHKAYKETGDYGPFK